MYKTTLGVALLLYTISLITTLAGMEILSWFVFLMVVGGLLYKLNKKSALPELKIHKLGTDAVVWALFATVVLGVVINGAPGIDGTESIGSMRWILLMYALLAAIAYLGSIPEKALIGLLSVASIVAINSLVMYSTGYNLIRNEAVNYATEGVFRGSGFFSIPTTYGHSAAMICCLAISALFLRYRPFKGSTWFFVLAAALILLSIVTSYTRAAYISLTAAVAVMALLKSKKLFASSMAALLVLGGTFYTLNEGFRLRFNSIFNMQYDSNSERLNLWRAHFAMFKDYPLIGLGLHDNERRNPEYNVKLGQPNAFTGNAHNNYLQFLAGTGVIGFSLFMLFILYYLRLSANLWKRRDQFSLFQQTLILGIIGAQVSFHIAGLMDNNFKDAEVHHLYMFMTVVLTALSLPLRNNSPAARG